MSPAVICKLHPNYNGLRKPKRNTKNPEGGVFAEGCPTCWEYHRELTHDLAIQERQAGKPRRSQRAIDTRVRQSNQDFASGKLKVQQDADTGDFEILYGTRCLAVVSNEDEVYLAITMFNEGMRFNHKDHVGDA